MSELNQMHFDINADDAVVGSGVLRRSCLPRQYFAISLVAFDLAQGGVGIIERHDEAFLAILAHHHGFKGVNVRASGLVFLFYLD